MKKLSVICMAALLLLAMSCKKKENENLEKGPGFRATLEAQSGNSKTQLVDGNKVEWIAGDEIRVVNANGTSMDFKAQSAGQSADFDNEAATEDFYKADFKAYYPKTLFNAGKISLPETQTYVENTFANGLNPMAAYSTDNTLEFKNICGMLALQLKGTCSVASVRVTSKDGNQVWGTGNLTLNGKDGEMIPELGTLTEGSATATLVCNPAIPLGATAKTFYIILPAGAFAQGFDLCVTDTEGKTFTKSSVATGVSIARSVINVMPELEVILTEPVTPSVTLGDCDFCENTVKGNVTIKPEDGSQHCEYGILYSETQATPTVENATKIIAHQLSDAVISGNNNEFTINIAGYFTSNKQYYVRAYAICDNTAYSTDVKTVTYSAPLPLASNWTNGHSPYPFSVSNSKKVYFSQGNLQFDMNGASLNAGSGQNVGGTWKFAEHQYEDLRGGSGTVIDRFSWSTSGYNHNEAYYRPWNMGSQTGISERHLFYAYGNGDADFNRGKADWGYNKIYNGGNTENAGWRTLSSDVSDIMWQGNTFMYGPHQDWNSFDGEWNYLIYKRPDAKKLMGLGQVGCVKGLIILPDKEYWQLPNGLSFTYGPSDWVNKYTYADWQKMEYAGAVFLPAAQPIDIERLNGGPAEMQECGFYWVSSVNHYPYGEPYNAGVCDLVFWNTSVNGPFGSGWQTPVWVSCYGHSNRCSVRLVIDAN